MAMMNMMTPWYKFVGVRRNGRKSYVAEPPQPAAHVRPTPAPNKSDVAALVWLTSRLAIKPSDRRG